MNLQDLRDELTARATASDQHTDDHTGDLLPGVRRKIRRTKQRRVATAVGSVAAAVALAVAVVPSVIDTSTPDPAENVPADITKHGVTLPGALGPDQLETGTIGEPGSNQLATDWIPTTHDVGLYTYCRATGIETRYWVKINGKTAVQGACSTSENNPPSEEMLESDNSVWLDAPTGKAATFSVDLIDSQGKLIQDQGAQLALGIYRAAPLHRPGPPYQIPPSAPGDYEKAGIRFRAKTGGDTLIAAQVADRGQGQASVTFTAPAGPVVLHSFCTADLAGLNHDYQLRITINGVERGMAGCSSEVTDATRGSAATINLAAKGAKVVATATLLDLANRPVSIPAAWIGLGVYEKGFQRQVADGIALDELTEYNGYTYRLADVRTTDAVSGKALEVATPEGKPFLIAYGSSDVGSTDATVTLSGLSMQSSSDTGGGVGTVGEAARGAGTASIAITKGKATKGRLILALYLPA